MESSKQVKIDYIYFKWSRKEGLPSISSDPCVFYRKYSVILTYVDDFVIVLHKQEKITSSI